MALIWSLVQTALKGAGGSPAPASRAGNPVGNGDGRQLPRALVPMLGNAGDIRAGSVSTAKPLPSPEPRLRGETVALAKAKKDLPVVKKKNTTNKEKQNQSGANVNPGFRSGYTTKLFNCVAGLFLETLCTLQERP